MAKPIFARLDLVNWEFAYLTNIKTNNNTKVDPCVNQSSFQKKLLASKGLTNKVQESLGLIRTEKIKALKVVLNFIKANNSQRMYFDQNGNRDLYRKLKEDEKL